jgi:hypothetical protein
MATSADRDEDDKKDDAAEHEEAAKGKDEQAGVEAAEKAAGASKSPGKAVSDGRPQPKAPAAASAKGQDEDEDEEEDEEDEEDDDEEEDAKPAPEPIAKSAVKRPAAKGTRGPGAARARAGQGSGSLGKSVMLFFIIVIGLGAGFAILGREPPVTADRPKWKVGDTVDVEITLVKTDRQDLACASAEEVAGKHCTFEATAKPWSKGDVSDDKKILKPYTTTDRVQFTAAGLWSDPALTPDKLPGARFSVKCKYKVEGTLKDLGVRWNPTDQWYSNKDWYAGSVSSCSLAP